MFFSAQLYCSSWKKFSAYRPKNEDFETTVFKRGRKFRKLRTTGSAYNSAVTFEQLNFSSVTKWSKEDLVYAFSRIRDERFIRQTQSPTFPRRSSWLYPHDGCWARAALSAQRSFEWGFKRPNKIFVFGDLAVKTPNAKEGVVTWWYHVVPLVKDENDRPIVIDPSIEAGTYITLAEWLTKMGDISKMKIAICNTYTYGPMDSCEYSNSKTEAEALNDQLHYLPSEWKNLEDLKRDPNKELGDSPPWK